MIDFAERSTQLKRQFFELLDKDLEFRYTVAGYLGLSEILRRLEEHDKRFEEILAEIKALREDQYKLWEEVRALREGQNRLWEEVRSLREGQNKLWEEVKALREGQNKLWEEVKALREGQNKLWEGQNKLWESVNKLWEGQNKLWENVNKLWEEVRSLRLGQEEMRGELRGLCKDVGDLKKTVERLTLSLEDEARNIIAYRLKQELGIEVELERVSVDTMEINVYGATEDLCIVGEVAVRLGPGLIKELLEKVEALKRKKSGLLRKKVLKLIYTNVAIPQALQVAQENNVWVLKWDRDLTSMKIEEVLMN